MQGEVSLMIECLAHKHTLLLMQRFKTFYRTFLAKRVL